MKKLTAVLLALVLAVSVFGAFAEEHEKISVKVLVLPKFEVGGMGADFPGEAQYYYEAYCAGGEEYDVPGSFEGNKLYVKDGVALCVTGMGKVNAAVTLMTLLTDNRFDFSDAYILSTGCAGSAYEYGVMGDVFLITAGVDFDLGHHADPREMITDRQDTWFYDASFDSAAYKLFDQELMAKLYDLVKDVKLETTPKTLNFMSVTFDGAEWAVREPKVLRGPTATGDNYWKGMYDHSNAVLMCETYGAPDPFAVTEMEDMGIAVAADRMGMLDRVIVLRDSVNMDVFMNGASPESLWDEHFDDALASEDSVESADIFATAMKNNFAVGKVIIDAILNGEV